ncbi:hypothetical protein GCM10023085_69970 [Actinomadura viridis]|uniref:Uncharacterized protein n=1 Tax=Actinomadura viridis TaxID=58110 RepID=A0A931DLB2_9ACTN|nr:hypothetical protein [Actinomadura viridis]MBG6090147.1 hypothetical protein [Actinomadura viridis]
MRESDHERGEGAISYLAVVLLVATVTGALVTSGVGTTVVEACESAICRVLGTGCPRPVAAGAAPAPSPSAAPTGHRSPPRPPIPKPTCEPDPDSRWAEGLHAHNDYQNKTPLQDALRNGAVSVEADVMIDPQGELQLKHEEKEHSAGTLRERYVEPLIERARANGGRIHPGRDDPFLLVIEIKDVEPDRATDPGAYASEETLKRAKERLRAQAYQRAIEQTRDLPPDVQVVFSAGRPGDAVGRQPSNVSFDTAPAAGCTLPAQLDPAAPEYDREYAKNFVIFNGKWSDCADRDGDQEISPDEQRQLNELVERAHNAGLKVRLWGGPDGARRSETPGDFRWCFSKTCRQGTAEDAWRAQMTAGVDLLNTNHLTTARDWIRSCGED